MNYDLPEDELRRLVMDRLTYVAKTFDVHYKNILDNMPYVERINKRGVKTRLAIWNVNWRSFMTGACQAMGDNYLTTRDRDTDQIFGQDIGVWFGSILGDWFEYVKELNRGNITPADDIPEDINPICP